MPIPWSRTLHSVVVDVGQWAYSVSEKAALGLFGVRPPRARVLAALCGLWMAHTAILVGPVASHEARSSAAAHRGLAGVTTLGAVLSTRCGVDPLRGVLKTSAPWPWMERSGR